MDIDLSFSPPYFSIHSFLHMKSNIKNFLLNAERNHASEGYETFEQGTPQGVSNGNELQVPAHVSHLRINVGQATAANNDDDDAMIYDDDDVDEIPDIEDDLLRKSLPSTALRRMKSVIKPGI